MPMKLLTALLCLVVLVTGCNGTAQRTNGTRQPTRQPRQPMTQTRQGADPECKQFGPGVYVDEPDYAPQATVADGEEAPADSLHGALKLPVYPEAVGVTTETREDQVVERYTVPTSNVVAARAALAQFYHHKMHDVGLVYQSPIPR